mgnify:CR=1 FL=1
MILGISIDEIKSSVLGLKPTEHRLELKKVGKINDRRYDFGKIY